MFVVTGSKKLRPRCRLPDKPVTFCMLGEVSGPAQTCILRETRTHSDAFTVQCVSWKIGLKAELVARQHHCHIWYFFFLLVLFSLSHTDSIYSLSLTLL